MGEHMTGSSERRLAVCGRAAMGVSDKSQRQEVIKAISQRRLRLKVAFPSDSDGAKSNFTPKMFIIVYLTSPNTKTSFRESPADVKIVRNERLFFPSSDPSELETYSRQM